MAIARFQDEPEEERDILNMCENSSQSVTDSKSMIINDSKSN